MERNGGEAERGRVNPAARRDEPGEPHDDLANREKPASADRVKGYQETKLDPRDDGGIGS